VCDILRYTEAVTRAHGGGPRSEEFLFPRLQIAGGVPQTPIVLVDDVVTLGGHFKAAKRRLEEGGATVLFGVACGRTVLETEGEPWSPGFIDLA
jgi:predicted amidophosphoribosyltransferase